MRLPAPVSRRLCRLAIAPVLLLVLAACAQQRQPGYYQTAPAGTASDAMHRAQGSSEVIAPAQIQLGFGDNKPAKPTQADAAQQAQTGDASAAPAGAQPAALADTHTFLGTVPCMDAQQCQAARMTLTLAPDGQWRARSVALDTSTTTTQMGCWYVIGDQPVRIMLQVGQQTKARLEFMSNSTLRILAVNDRRPLLNYTLTRQADIDPIDELSGHPAQTCTQPGA